MGIYLNPKNENFTSILKADIYVDKTMMLKVLNGFIDKGNKYICVSRPRRFGKTIAQNMIAAYYSKGCDSHELFEKLKISNTDGYEEKLNKFNVIKIDLNSEYQNSRNKEKMLTSLEEWIADHAVHLTGTVNGRSNSIGKACDPEDFVVKIFVEMI